MPLELRTQRNGSLRKTWYGRYEVNGRKLYSNLTVKVAGTPPTSHSLKDEGDAAFERSRASAQAKLDQLVAEARSQQGAARLVEQLYEIKTGETLRSVPLATLAEAWAAIPRRRKPSARYRDQSQVTLRRFATFVARTNVRTEELAHVTRSLAQGFMAAESGRGVTARTWNDTLSLLRTTCKALLPAGVVNPFQAVPMQETESIFRKAFSPEELAAIVATARDDDFIRPLLVTGMCTAMRRGDCCLLQWKDVDLERRFITVKTAKTRQTVSIPIFPMLEEELKRQAREAGRGAPSPNGAARPLAHEDVFPKQAAMYRQNPAGITWRVKKVLAVALGEPLAPEAADASPPQRAVEVVRQQVADYLAALPEGAKRERMTQVFALYGAGKSINGVVAASGVSKASVSEYLKTIETAVGSRIVRGRPTGRSLAARMQAQPGLLREERVSGARRASIRDFHSLRVTWVTLALTAGVPLELVQKVTGHKTTEIVLKHYFQPGREAFRQALQTAMPKLLMNGAGAGEPPAESKQGARAKRPKESSEVMRRVREILAGMTAQTWQADRERLVALVGR